MIIKNITNNVATLTLNRPEVFNSFNREMALLLQSELDECEKNPEVRAIVITGSGKAFCAGQDLKEVTSPELNPGFKKILEEHYNPIISRIRNIEKPIIGAINGVAAGAGHRHRARSRCSGNKTTRRRPESIRTRLHRPRRLSHRMHP